MLSKNADFEFHTTTVSEKSVGVLIIQRAVNQTVMFQEVDYVRIGSYTKKLSEYPALQAQLWDRLRTSKFEERFAKQDLDMVTALGMLEYSAYFDLVKIPQSTDAEGFFTIWNRSIFS